MTAIVSILLLVVGMISIFGTTHLLMADQKGEVCVIFSCGNANITAGTSSSAGGSQPTPITTTLTVIKKVKCGAVVCASIEPSDFNIKVIGNSPSPESFKGSETGTKVTLGPGDYTISETGPPSDVFIFGNDFSGDCHRLDATADATGTIEAGETQECTITNSFNP